MSAGAAPLRAGAGLVKAGMTGAPSVHAGRSTQAVGMAGGIPERVRGEQERER